MIRQGLVNKDLLEKKFKVLRTSIMLGNIKNREDTINKFEETARLIDENKRNEYEELLASKMYTTKTIEEEKDRLNSLISLIENRVQERNDFIDDYMKITSNFIDDLPKPSMENELFDLKDKYNNINLYLDNNEKIKNINNELSDLREVLQECYETKANNEIINSKFEDELIDEFNKFISKDEYYTSLNYMDIDSEIEKIEISLNDKKEVMKTFISSYEALVQAGVSGAEREEYLSYVSDSKKDYYNDLEKKYVLEIYKEVLDKETDYDKLYTKRDNLDKLFDKRNDDRRTLEISSYDKLEYFTNLCSQQFLDIRSQKINIDNIDKLILKITDLESELDSLEESNNSREILDLLEEFNVEKTKIEKVELPNEEEIHEEIIQENEKLKEVREPNLVVKVTEPIKLNVKTASDTAKLVMKKVVVVLEPKKFGDKKDKLKEAERELEERKRKEQEEKLLKENKKKEEEIFEQEEVKKVEQTEEIEQFEETSIDEQIKEDGLFEFDSTPFDETDNNEDKLFNDDAVLNNNSIFVDNNDSDNEEEFFAYPKQVIELNKDTIINLDTKDVEGSKSKEVDAVKLNIENDSITVPTEIFIEEPIQEPVKDLFKETDPFLDDNQFELNNNGSKKDEISSNMPRVFNIGSVKPNTMLSQIEEAQKENEDIILPTMGLANDNKENVPILSENYIN